MGSIRSLCASILQESGALTIPKGQLNFLWVENFPLFSPVDPNQARKFDDVDSVPHFEATHNPFTSPHPDDVALLTSDPLKVRALHYDLVLNGSEIGGGSIRIHSAALQEFVLSEILKVMKKTKMIKMNEEVEEGGGNILSSSHCSFRSPRSRDSSTFWMVFALDVHHMAGSLSGLTG